MANSYLNKTFGTPTDTKKYTMSVWVKRSSLGVQQSIARSTNGSDDSHVFTFNSDDSLRWDEYGSSSTIGVLKTTRKFRDTSAWYHVVLWYDSANSTAGDRMRMWINGVEETAFATDTNPSVNAASAFNKASQPINIGRTSYGSGGNYFDGYLSHMAFVDGLNVAHTSFGQTDSTSGTWKFKAPTGITWGTNGFHLKFENSGNLGLDSSSNTSNWTVNGNLKQALDTPSNVYCTMNPLSTTQNFNLSNGNNTFGAAADNKYITGNLGGDSEAASTGYYFEYKVNANNLGNSGEGFRVGVKSVENIFASDNDWYGLQETASDLIYEKTNGSSSTDTNIGSASNGDIVMVAWGKGGKIWTGVNGVWVDGGNPSSGSGEQYSGLTGVYAPFIMCSLTNGMNGSSMNFGNGFFGTTAITSAGSNGNGSLFEYDVPSGFYALNTKNINTYG